jgi:hypothetical protein
MTLACGRGLAVRPERRFGLRDEVAGGAPNPATGSSTLRRRGPPPATGLAAPGKAGG